MPPQLRRKRQRSIRVLLTVIFVVPLASLIGLWVFAASVTVSNAIREHNFTSQDNQYGRSAQMLLGQLAQERLTAFEWLSSGHHTSGAPYLGEIRKTDEAVTALKQGLYSGPAIVSTARPALGYLYGQLGRLGSIRTAVERGTMSPIQSFNDYNEIVDAEFNLYSDLVVVNNTSLYMQAAASVEAGRAVELTSREVTLVGGALMAGGQMSTAERLLFAQTAATRQYLMSEALREFQPALGSGYQLVENSSEYATFTGLESGISASIGSRGPVPGAGAFSFAAADLLHDYQGAESQDRLALSSLGTQIGNQLLLEVGLAGGLGLLAVIVSIFLMIRFGRRISRDLTGLQHAALDLAEERLPRVVAALSRGEDVDLAAEAVPPIEGRIAETARVAAAFSSVQRTAVEAAVGQARLRAGVAQVFRNLAWRSQSLLHRQLTLLDGMERRSTEPETLEELFQLDHLTTRMRRHAEGLIILSGATPGRGWREPVPVIDVLRGAIAEVEDYKRVTVLCESQDAIVGAAVADVIHMLAELIENATTYSPASTEVTIRAERVANGFAVEIEDRGIGVGADEMAGLNHLIANPPEFDLADSNQLGLFVVARLAAKHHIRVTLRSSPFGGTAAIALFPHQVVAMSDGTSALDPGVRIVGNGRELISSGRALPASGPEAVGTGRELTAAAGLAGGLEQRGDGAGFADTGPDLLSSTGPDLLGRDPLGLGRDALGVGRDLLGSGPLPARESREISVSGIAEALGLSWNPAAGESREAPPAGGHLRLSPYGPPDEEAPSPDSRDLENGTGSDPKPWLPRRVRQASLAPQLKTDAPLRPEDIQPEMPGAEDGLDEAGAGPDPDDTRALVQSLQFGLERARTADSPGDDTWISPPGESWPSAGESWSPPGSEVWPSPAGNPDLAAGPEDDEGQ